MSWDHLKSVQIQKVRESLTSEPQSLPEIVTKTGLSGEQVDQCLLELAHRGDAEFLGGMLELPMWRAKERRR